MLVRYHWGYGVGHTYASGTRTMAEDFSLQTTSNTGAGADTQIASAASVPAEAEDQANKVDRQEVRPPVENEDGSDECSLGEDDMVYQNDSDSSMSGDDFDDEACQSD
jgi:hypothetical protein